MYKPIPTLFDDEELISYFSYDGKTVSEASTNDKMTTVINALIPMRVFLELPLLEKSFRTPKDIAISAPIAIRA